MKALLPLIVAIGAISAPAFAQKDIMTEKTAGEIKPPVAEKRPHSATWHGVTITDDTTTNASRYLTFTDATTGNETTLDVSSTKLTFNPSTGALTVTTLTPTNALAIANGGTGQTSASAALSALGGINTGKAIAMSLVFG